MFSSRLINSILNPPVKGNSQYFLQTALALLTLAFSLFFITGKNGLWTSRKRNKRRVDLMKQFPGLRSYPVLGSLPEMLDLVWSPARDMMPWARRMVKKHGPIFKLWFPGQPKLFITCPDTAMKLLQNDSLPAKPMEVTESCRIGNTMGLIGHPEEIHTPRKKLWLQWITKKNIDKTAGRFRQEAVRLCEGLEQFAETGQAFNVMDPVIYTTFRAITYSAFGEAYMNNIPESEGLQLLRDIHTFGAELVARCCRPWITNDWVHYLTAGGRECYRCVQRSNEITKKAIKARQLLRSSSTERMKENHPCFLDHLLDLHERGLLTETEVLYELNMFIVAGYDTSGLAVCYALQLLSHHSDHQAKVVEELVEIFGQDMNEFTEITPGHLRDMRYLELCIKEALRLYPVAAILFRRSIKEVELQDGRIIPEDTDVYMVMDQMHLSPKYFPEPEKFIPTRHLVPIPAFMPFALGSRNCIGQVYAMQEVKMILAHLLMSFRWEAMEKGRIKTLAMGVNVPENGVHFRIERRSKK